MNEANLKARIETLERQLSALTVRLGQVNAQASMVAGTFRPVFLAKDNGNGTFTEYSACTGTPAVRPAPARTGTLINPATTDASLCFVMMELGSSGYQFVKFIGGNLFPIALTQTGGSAGTKTTACTFTYTVKDIAGTTTLGTGVAVSMGRPTIGKFTAATKGLAYYATGSTTPVILWCDEVKTAVGC